MRSPRLQARQGHRVEAIAQDRALKRDAGQWRAAEGSGRGRNDGCSIAQRTEDKKDLKRKREIEERKPRAGRGMPQMPRRPILPLQPPVSLTTQEQSVRKDAARHNTESVKTPSSTSLEDADLSRAHRTPFSHARHHVQDARRQIACPQVHGLKK